MTFLFDQRSIFRAGSQDWQQICQENVPMKYSICSSQRICWQTYFAWLTFTFVMRKHMLLPRQDGSDLLCCACCRITNRLLRCRWGSKTPRLLWFLPNQLHWTFSLKHPFTLLLIEYNFPQFFSEKITCTLGEEEARLASSLVLAMIVQHLVVSGLGRSEVQWKSIWGEDGRSRSPLPNTEYTFGPVAYCPSLVSFQILCMFAWPQQTPHSHRSSVFLFCGPSHILYEIVEY